MEEEHFGTLVPPNIISKNPPKLVVTDTIGKPIRVLVHMHYLVLDVFNTLIPKGIPSISQSTYSKLFESLGIH